MNSLIQFQQGQDVLYTCYRSDFIPQPGDFIFLPDRSQEYRVLAREFSYGSSTSVIIYLENAKNG